MSETHDPGAERAKLLTVDGATWLVVRKRETDPPEVYPFAAEAEARVFHDRAQMQWSDCYLCQVVRHGMQPERASEPQDVEARLHQRAWDLLRQMRGHLADENLISLEEYAWLAANAPGADAGPGNGSPAPRRLESYDEMRAELAAARRALTAMTVERDALRAEVALRDGRLRQLLEAWGFEFQPGGRFHDEAIRDLWGRDVSIEGGRWLVQQLMAERARREQAERELDALRDQDPDA